MKRPFLTSLLATCALSGAALADQLVTDDLIVVEDLLCVGNKCAVGEPEIPDRQGLKIKDLAPAILFEDMSDSGFPSGDWSIRTGETTASGAEEFAVQDEDAGTRPFRILGGAAENTLVIGEDGHVGINTMLPTKQLHVTGTSSAVGIRMDSGSAFWELRANPTYFQVRNANEHDAILHLEKAAPNHSIYVHATGNVGLGTNDPSAPLEVFGEDTYNFFRITADGAAINQSVDITFTQGPLGTGELRYNIVDGDGPEMRLNANGDMVLGGTLTTGGPTCAGGCDAVFTERRIIPEGEYAARMWADGHLPFVGPTRPEAPINVSEKMGGMLNALEHAHVFIERQNGRIATLEAEIAALRGEQAAQIAALTRQLAALSGTVEKK